MSDSKSALIAMSGGVDSSVAAYLMKEKGFTCEGTTMRLYKPEQTESGTLRPCGSLQDIEDAKVIAAQLDMPHTVLDFTFDFQEEIIGNFIRTYEAGGTPNPCIDCNRCMKFRRLLDFAARKNLHYIVTGHYARIVYDEAAGRYLLKKAVDEGKDQSYVLYTLSQEQLAHTLFPLGEYSKAEIRAIAEQCGFSNANKQDSQDICFVPDGDYVGFMEAYTGKHYPEGNFLDLEGNVVGTHRGSVRYTIGQRKGLGLAMHAPVYVCKKDMEANTVTVGPETALFSSGLIAEQVNWIAYDHPTDPIRAKAKTRYRQKEQWCTVYPREDGTFRLVFDEPQRALTTGQSVVLYQEDTVIGGGIIREAL